MARQLNPGMGEAVAQRTVLRYFLTDQELQRLGNPREISINPAEEKSNYRKWNAAALNSGLNVTIDPNAPLRGCAPEIRYETWGDVAKRVAEGNSALCKTDEEMSKEFKELKRHIANGVVLMSGRHLQHGDETQPNRTQDVFVNCLGGNTKIITQEYGSIPIKKIVGETVLLRARDGVWREAMINYHGEQMLYEYTFIQKGGNGRTISVESTRDHRWFLEDGSETTSLGVGDKIESALPEYNLDRDAIAHGIVFGDGSNNKSRNPRHGAIASAGRNYPRIRLCGDKKNLLEYFDQYNISYPEWSNGDPVVYIGSTQQFWKDLPFTYDPEYVAGFIKGWWLADGSKSLRKDYLFEITTSNKQAVNWMKEYASIAGYTITSIQKRERKNGDGSYNNGKPLYHIRFAHNRIWKVKQIKEVGIAPVYCPEEPVTGGFSLSNGLLTGNCATSGTSFSLFYLLLNGAGVGRSYDDSLMVVDWDNAPNLRCVLSDTHPDFDYSAHESVRSARHKYGSGKDVLWYKVPDSREGWAKAVELYENAAHERIHSHKMLILDFSDVRESGAPIKGMQNRPSSGPVPLMNALLKVASIKGAGIPKWLQALFVDHYLAECVLVGGARRAARMATKHWTDKSVLDFIGVKRPTEFFGSEMDEVISFRAEHPFPPSSFLWSANNSVTVDAKFWDLVSLKPGEEGYNSDLSRHARKVFKLVTEYSYGDGTGEPGFINVDKLVVNDDGIEYILEGRFIDSKKYTINDDTQIMLRKIAKRAMARQYQHIVNPCGEISLHSLAGFCTIGDAVPFHASSIDEAESGIRAMVRALIRTNTMDSIYHKETRRTNRIGIGLTGVHEFAWKFFKYGFRDLIDEEKSKDFWMTLARFNRAIKDEAETYSAKLGMPMPHTLTTTKPSGTISKLFGLTEGWHLPSMRWYLRWVQYRNDDPLVEIYKAKGYPTRKLVQYEGTTIVGFPTEPVIMSLKGITEHVVTAAEATPEEQYKWLMLGEKYWIRGVDENGEPLEHDYGNQISYSLKFKPTETSFEEFTEMLIKYQSQIRCCSVMPQEDSVSYEYQPEEPVTKARFEGIVKAIEADVAKEIGSVDVGEDVDFAHVDCESGACPIDFTKDENE